MLLLPPGGSTPVEQARVDVMLDQSMDFRNGWVRVCYATAIYGQNYVSEVHCYLVISDKSLDRLMGDYYGHVYAPSNGPVRRKNMSCIANILDNSTKLLQLYSSSSPPSSEPPL